VTTSLSLYAPRDSGLDRLHPLTKLIFALFGVVVGITLPGVWPNYAFFLLVLLPLAAWGRIVPEFLRAVFKIALPFAVSLFVIQGLFWTNGTPIFQLGPLSLKAEGLIFAAKMTGRILVVMGSITLFVLSTRPDHLMVALTQRGAPKTLTYVLVSAIQLVPRFQSKASSILDAQRARGLETEGGFFQRVRALLPVSIPLVLGSIVDVEERSIALEARGFSRDGPKTSYRVLVDTLIQRIARMAMLLGSVALIVWAVVRALAR
jgi:energy-coupling factor transport system permease protein